jgi:aryl-alcohol dehydrogenase-like predicted oxidoreductase
MSAFLPLSDLRLGLGCSRLGSVNGATGAEARDLIQDALDQGVRFFDTSNIYAQGDSERYLGSMIGDRADCIICTKGGKYLSLKNRLLTPAKGLIRWMTRKLPWARQSVSKARARPMPTRWDGPFLLRSLDASLRRLKRRSVDIYMLHSPPAEIIRQGHAIAALEEARVAGKILHIGVSADDTETVSAALDDPRISVIQLPLHACDNSYDPLILRAKQQGIAIIAREILSGASPGTDDYAGFVARRIREVVSNPDIAITLVGTTKRPHLAAAIDAACPE